jgi:carboxyl-terminal processing protease
VPTFGKGSVQTVIEMEDGSGLKLTIARYYTPRGRSIQEKGITPDFVVGESEGATAQKSEQLREKDLKRHFKGEGDVDADPDKLKQNLPENLKTWDVTEKLSDYQLKIALNYLNGLGPPGKATAAKSP